MIERTSKRLVARAGGRPRRPFLFVNLRSGNGTAERLGLARLAREQGVEVVVIDPDGYEEQVRSAVQSRADALGVAGGDGSLVVAASVAAAHGIPFVCIPAGTRNHFALDLGVDRRDVVGTLDAFSDAVERDVDLAEVNGRPFLNNVSLGLYGEAVRQAAYRDAKARTLVQTAERVLAPHGRAQALRLVDDVGREHDHPAVVLVSNNPYALDPRRAGTRPQLDSGRLGVIVLDPPDHPPHPPGRAWSVERLDLGAVEPVHAGIDGEAVELVPPLHFTTRPKALRVLISRRRASALRPAPLKSARP